jgi:hypothetical protein
MQLTLRNASIGELFGELKEQQERKVDLIVPARDLWSHNGQVVVANAGEPKMDANGVSRGPLYLAPSNVYDEGLVEKLSNPGRPVGRAFVRGLRETGRTDVLDHVVNGLLHGSKELNVPSDDRKFFLRSFSPSAPGGTGYARALLSNSYRPIDNWDVLNSIIKGMTAAGLDSHVVKQADLTDRRMYLKIVVPEISALAPTFLRDYVAPYSKKRGADIPTVFAGFVIKNGETGGSAFSITPELTFEVCDNGMTVTEDMIRKTHLGAKVEDEGVVRVSERTRKINLEFVESYTADAITSFLDKSYMERVLLRLTEQAGGVVEHPQAVVETITKRAAFSDEDAEGIMNAFIDGGDRTKGGILQAITAYSQRVADPDHAYEIEADALAAAGFSKIGDKSFA